ncbi:SPARC-like protein 1 [Rhea pennata]|uniref:SPARC-like protein 1 n=1 Tax=Rhea pennata TaxID=8795 RepID=UPI002E25C60C
MKTAALFICLVGSAFAIPTYPLIHKLGLHGQKSVEKAQDIHSDISEEENTEYVNKGDLLSSHRNKNKEVSLTDTEHKEEPRPAKTWRSSSSEHEAKNSLKSINFLPLHLKLSLASDKHDSDSGSSSREQFSSEYYQFRTHEKPNTEQVMDDEKKPADALSEHNTWKYNKNTVGLSENNSEGAEEEKMEEEEEEWGEETDHRDMNHKPHLTNQDKQYNKRQQNEESRQSDEIMRDSSQPLRITKRHSEKSDREQKKDETQRKPHEEEKISFSQKNSNEDPDDKQQSRQGKDNSQVNNQSGHETVVKRQYEEDSDDDDDHDSSDVDGEEDLSNVWEETTYEEGKRIQSNNPGSISTEQEGEGTDEDDSAVSSDNNDYQDAKIKHFVHFEEDYHHEPLNSDSKEQIETSTSEQSVNSMNPEDKVKITGRSYSEGESATNSSGKAFLDPCRNFHCKRGRVCHTNEQEKPSCICQDPAACPSTKDYEHVCGTDNKTYDGICQLFGTKCQLEGTKMGHQLHLDYMGACKYIPHCTDYEVDQFPLRMRDWLKNILMQYYERDLETSGFLTEKQRSKAKKIYQNEKRLMAGDHPVELLLHDFEKNYQMYVYPVHWQFYQLDQHPVDRLLTRSELAPLRASLVPMEHCITRFFQECDGDKDKLISLKEWCHCFGIKREDVDENLLF